MPALRSWHRQTLLEFLQASKRVLAVLLQKKLHVSQVNCGATRPRTATAAFYRVVHYARHDFAVKFYDCRLVHGDGDVRRGAGGTGGASGAAIISVRSFRVIFNTMCSLMYSCTCHDFRMQRFCSMLVVLHDSDGEKTDASRKSIQPYGIDLKSASDSTTQSRRCLSKRRQWSNM